MLKTTKGELRELVGSSPEAMIIVDEDGRIMEANTELERLFGYTARELTGANLETLLPKGFRKSHANHREQFFSKATVRPMSTGLDLYGLRKDGSEFPVEVSLHPFQTEDGPLVYAAVRDVTEHKAQQERLKSETNILRLLTLTAEYANQAESLEDAIQYSLDTVCGHTGWPVGHAYIRGLQDPDRLVATDLWHLADPGRFDTFRRVTADTGFERGVGLPGRVWQTGKPVWIQDVTVDSDFPRATLASDIGVRAGFAIPVFDESDVLAVLEFFAEDVVEPDESLLGMLTQIGLQLGHVSARHKAQEELRQSEERFRNFFAMPSIGAAMYRVGDSRYISVSDSFCQMVGYSREELASLTWVDLTHPDDVAENIRLMENISSSDSGDSYSWEKRYIRKDGEIVYVELSEQCIRGNDGKPEYNIVSVRDVTARRQAEEEIRQSREQLNAILEGSPAGIAVTLREDGRTVYANARFADLLGLGEGRNLGRDLKDFWADLEERDRVIGRAREAGFLNDIEVRRRRSDGSEFWALMSALPITYEGQEALLSWTYDITERKRVEEELTQKRLNLRHVLENVAQGIVKWSADRTLVNSNRHYQELLDIPGHFLEEGRPLSDLALFVAQRGDYGDGDPQELAEARIQYLYNGEAHRNELTIGGETTYDVLVQPTDDGGVVIAYTDITERKLAEQQLKESEREIRRIFDTANEGIWMVDNDARTVQLNDAMCKILGRRSEEILGRRSSEFVDKANKKILHEQLERRERGETGAYEIALSRPDGSQVPCLFNASAMLDEKGEKVGSFSMVTDITERKKSENRFRALLESAPDAMVIVNADGAIIQSNRRTEELFGYSADELLGKKVEVLLPEGMRKQHPAHRNDFFAQARVRPMGVGLELFGQAKDGREFPIEISLSPIEIDDGLLVSAAVRDITERKQADNELRAAKEQAEAALADLTHAQARLVTTEKMASLGQLTAGIAHEIKNPLNFVNNFSETSVELLDELKEVLEPVKGNLDEDALDDVEDIFETLKGDLKKIHHHGGRADSIVKSMLLHARGDTSERKPTSVNNLVSEALNLAYHGERARDKSFQVTLDQSLDDAAGEADLVPQEITRVMVNLLSNAFYAVKKRTESAVSTGYVPAVAISTAGKDGNVEIRVRDNGTGMPQDVREKLFEPFFTTKPTGEGTGLGLSMCFDIIVQQHGGQIEVDSAPDSFTEFVISLPRRTPDGRSGANGREVA
ncbi:MAG: PAS domain S-box protein [Hyphomicrobiales bacterium]